MHENGGKSSQLLSLPTACLYLVLGVVGLLLNLLTVLMILTKRVYRLSAYTIMANLALADALVIVVAGVGCGVSILIYSTPSSKEMGESSATLNRLGASISIRSGGNHAALLSPAGQTQHQLGQLRNIQLSQSNTRTKRKHIWNKDCKYYNSNEHRKKRKWKSLLSKRLQRSSLVPTPEEFLNVSLFSTDPLHKIPGELTMFLELLHSSMAFVEIAAWTAGVISYAFLGINRCVAICFYGTKAKTFNRVSIAILSSACTWLIGIVAASVGTFPEPLIGVRLDMWTFSFLTAKYSRRSAVFISISLLIHSLSVALQWVCSSLVLLKIRQVKKKISKNKLNQNSANRFRKQARLTFQFFYPSLFCTISSMLYFAKPFISHHLSDYHLIALHIIWLNNHFCNPFIYAYFNERMRHSYYELISCAQFRFMMMHRRNKPCLKNRLNVSMRSARQQSANQRQSIRSGGSRSNGNFVRNSLQLQSRDFEQLCEFMMRVNPMYESSEGWRESSSDMENELENQEISNALEPRSKLAASTAEYKYTKPNSIVGELGKETLEHWAAFAKKASI